jgi:hypothetical protein
MFLLPTERGTTLLFSVALAADSQLGPPTPEWDDVHEPCVFAIKSAETLYHPRGPIPEPGPLVIGCKLVDCGPGADGPGPIDLRITLTGNLVKNAIIEFENMPVQDAARIDVRGNARHVKGTTRFEVHAGTTVLRGLGFSPKNRPPVAIPRLALNPEALEALKQAAIVDDLLANIKSPVTLTIEQFRGRVTVNEYAVRYDFRICPRPLPPSQETDSVEFSNGIPPDNVLILAPGRVGTGPLGCHGYKDEVYTSNAASNVMLDNHLKDEGVLALLGASVRHHVTSSELLIRCHSEVVVYSKSSALAVVNPVTPPWTDQAGDRVPLAPLDHLLKVPVTLWILDSSEKSNQAVAEIRFANDYYKNWMCGITFNETPTIHSVMTDITLPAGKEDAYLRFDPGDGPTLMQEGCNNPGSQKPCLYSAGNLNVYFVQDIGGDFGFTSYSPTYGTCPRDQIPRCDNFGDMIFLVPGRQPETLAHEFGHTLELEGLTGVGTLSNGNIMWEYDRDGTSLTMTKGQCYRANVDEFSYVNSSGVRSPGSYKHRYCPVYDTPSEQCPDLSF